MMSAGWTRFRGWALWMVMLVLGMGMLFAGCGDTKWSVSGNPFSSYADLYKRDPLSTNYVFYYMNEKIGDEFNDDRKAVGLLESKNEKSVPVKSRRNSINGEEKWFLSRNPDSKVTYKGEMKDDKPDGLGILYVKGRALYKGYFKNGQYDDYGQYYDTVVLPLSNYTKYMRPGEEMPLHGLFRKDQYSSASLTGNALKYEGNFKEGHTEGEGILYEYHKLKPKLNEIDTDARDIVQEKKEECKKKLSISEYTRQNALHRELRTEYEAKIINVLNAWLAQHPGAQIIMPDTYDLSQILETYDMDKIAKDHSMGSEIKDSLLSIEQEYQARLIKEGLEYPSVTLINDQVENIFKAIPFIKGEFKGMSYIEEGTEYSADGYKLFTGEFSGTRWEEGKEFYPDGHVKYEGEFNGKNQYDGKGTMYDESGDVSYKGYWKDGDYNVA